MTPGRVLEAERTSQRGRTPSIIIAPSVLSADFARLGEEKAAIFSAIRAGNSQVPAARVQPVGELFWFVDQAAAGGQQVPRRTGARAR